MSIRNQMMKVASNFKQHRSKIAHQMSMLSANYSTCNSPIICDTSATMFGSSAKLVPGVRVPNILLTEDIRLHDKLKLYDNETKHIMLLFPNSALNLNDLGYKNTEQFALKIMNKYGKCIRVMIILPNHSQIDESLKESIEIISDTKSLIGHTFGTLASRDISTYIIRPDHYVGFFSSTINEEQIFHYLEKIFV